MTIIGFDFMMATGRYDLRKACQQAEAIAIRTEYSRADLLSPADAAKVQTLLRKYLDQRISFYTTRISSIVASVTATTKEQLLVNAMPNTSTLHDRWHFEGDNRLYWTSQ